MDKKILSEELERMLGLFGHKRGVVVSEQKYNTKGNLIVKDRKYKENKIPDWGKSTKGTLDLTQSSGKFSKFIVPDYWLDMLNYTKKDYLFEPNQILYITLSTIAGWYGDNTTEETTKKPEEPNPISISFNLTDPFIFDTTNLTEEASKKFDDFIEKYNSEKKTHSDIWPDFLEFIKNNGGVKVIGYASQDGNPNDRDGGRLPACSTYGVGKGPRNQYNLCLSIERAKIIKDKIIEKIPELKDSIVSEGLGETCNFGPCWTKNNRVTPRDTRENRRFEVIIPKYSDIKKPPIEVEPDEPDVTEPKKIGWLDVKTYTELYGPNDIKFKVKYIKDKKQGIIIYLGDITDENILSIIENVPERDSQSINGKSSVDCELNENGCKIKAGDSVIEFKKWYKYDPSSPSEFLLESGEAVFKEKVADNEVRLFRVKVTIMK
jgi:hypothetical protein